MTTALVTGAGGQDGSYLVELLVEKGYSVVALFHRRPTVSVSDQVTIRVGDVCDGQFMRRLLDDVAPDEVYNLAAQSDVGLSFQEPMSTVDATAVSAIRLLDAVRASGGMSCRVYFAGSSEMFGSTAETPQNERTAMVPRSPYGSAKVFAYNMGRNYRDAYGLHVVNGILYNHDSPRRPLRFVTRKITRSVARIKTGLQDKLVLGSTDAKRDWGYAKEYVEAVWLMMQHPKPQDFVVGTGVLHSVQQFLELAFAHVGLLAEDYVEQDACFVRPSEVSTLCADASHAFYTLGWAPKVTVPELVGIMMEHDLKSVRDGDE